MKFVHAADLHLDSPLRGLERYDGAPTDEIRGATRRAFENLIALCLEEQADFLLLAGDVYDGDWRDYSTGLFFLAQLGRLRESGTRVYLIRGNHDAQSHITRQLKLPEHVVSFSTRKAVTHVDEALGVAVHGQGFARREVSEDLAAAYPEACAGLFNIGLLHTALEGREGHDAYAPTSATILASKGYDYWALGHVHAREVVRRAPWIVFPGNLQGRHVREAGPKGATLVTVAADGAVESVEARALDVVRWAEVAVEASDCQGGDEVVAAALQELRAATAAAEGRLLAARVRITGTSAAHSELRRNRERWTSEVRAASFELGADVLWVEKVQFETLAPLDLVALRRRDDPLGRVARVLHSLQTDAAGLEEVAAGLRDLQKKLPAELREGQDGIDLEDPVRVRELLRATLQDIEQTLLPRLLHEDPA